MEKKYNPIVFFDFDNTIARFDVFDDMIERFSKNDNWVRIEERWKQGKIGSRECLEKQLEGLGLTKKALDRYLVQVKLDPYFKKLIQLLRDKKIRLFILSDNFDYILKSILRHNGIRGLRVYSNKLEFFKERLIPHFPFSHKKCKVCAHCKTKNLLANAKKENIIVYIGDGRSDICPARHADIIFAKDSLQKYCKEKKLPYIPFKGLKEVYNYFKGSLR